MAEGPPARFFQPSPKETGAERTNEVGRRRTAGGVEEGGGRWCGGSRAYGCGAGVGGVTGGFLLDLRLKRLFISPIAAAIVPSVSLSRADR